MQQLIPAHRTRIEMRVINSRFIATAGPAFSVDEARAFIGSIKGEFADATHNVPAYLIGHGASVIAHCSDDGEPSGTAGPPALAVLRGSGLGDVAVVVTRYFGGTKLGTGGLVRAYGDAVREVLSVLPRAVKVATHTVRIDTPYSLLEQIRRLVGVHQGQMLDETFAGQVTMTMRLPQDRLPDLQSALQELSRGRIQAKVTKSSESTIVPLKTER
ncbi:MAG: YigZ family protein [Anaerolineae bacterium]|jgi:uncharacterized YigZ family protein